MYWGIFAICFSFVMIKDTVMQIEKHWCFKSILEISHSSYSQFYCNLTVKLAIFLKKVAYFLTVSIAFFAYKRNFTSQ